MRRGEIVRARDYSDEGWDYGIYICEVKEQGAHRILTCPDGGKMRPVMYSHAELIGRYK